MPTFSYTAKNNKGAKQSGTVSATTKQAATQQLQSRGLKVDNLTEGKAAAAKGNRKVKSYELLIFTRQLSTIAGAGLPLLQGLDILADQTEDANFAAVIDAIGQEVESGESFSDALRKFPKAFPDLYVSMVRAGEAGGDLDGVLLQLADYLEATEELKRRIKSAMSYPVVAFSMIILIAGGLTIVVVPQFADIFESMSGGKVPLPVPTQMLLDFSDILRTPFTWLVIAILTVPTFFGIKLYGATPGGRYNLDALKLRMPIFGTLLKKVAISRFTRTLSTLTKSGVAILQALEIVERTAGNEVYAKAIREAADNVRNGETLAEPLARAEVFPTMVTRMISIGEKTGALETMLMKISDFYDSEVRAMVDGLTSLIEPLLIGIMGVVVGGIVIALFMPILKITDTLQ
jgi:type IV pilus assembly protein PilC